MGTVWSQAHFVMVEVVDLSSLGSPPCRCSALVHRLGSGTGEADQTTESCALWGHWGGGSVGAGVGGHLGLPDLGLQKRHSGRRQCCEVPSISRFIPGAVQRQCGEQRTGAGASLT